MAVTPKHIVKQIYLDSEDISNKVHSFELNNNISAPYKTISLNLKDSNIVYKKREYLRKDAGYGTTRIACYINSIFMGNFFWEESNFSTQIPGVQASISGKSATAVLDWPYATELSTTFSELNSKEALARTLCGTAVTLIWSISDSPLPALKFGVHKKTPMQMIQALANASKANVTTDENDNLIVSYKTFALNGVPSKATLDGKVDVYNLTERRSIPEGRNKIRIQEQDSGAYPDNYTDVSLILSKYRILGNSIDYCNAIATVKNVAGVPVGVTLYTNEEFETGDYTNCDPYGIPTQHAIDTLIGVWKDDGAGGHGEQVVTKTPTPGTTRIEITENSTQYFMPHNTYWITYNGGEMCNFSVVCSYSAIVDISDTSVMLRNGTAITTIRSQENSGGYVQVNAWWNSPNATKYLTVEDPNVGSIRVWADPSGIGENKTSKVYALVSMPSGTAIYSGYTVAFSVIKGPGSISSIGATTVNTTINNEIQKASGYRNISTSHTILETIYGIWTNKGHSGHNFTTDINTWSGTSIELKYDGELFIPELPYYIQYKTGGLARITYHSPFVSKKTIAYVRGSAGSLQDTTEITITPTSTDSSPTQTEEADWQRIGDLGVTPIAAQDNALGVDYENWMLVRTYPLPIRENMKSSDGSTGQWQYSFKNETVTNCRIRYDHTLDKIFTYVYGALYSPETPTDTGSGGTSTSQNRFSVPIEVIDSVTKKGIGGAKITLAGAGDNLNNGADGTNDDGFSYFNVYPVTYNITVFKVGYDLYTDTIDMSQYEPASSAYDDYSYMEADLNASSRRFRKEINWEWEVWVKCTDNSIKTHS